MGKTLNWKSANLKPGVSARGLLLIAGLIWIGIGAMLDSFAYFWPARC